MIHVVTPENQHAYADLLDQMFRLRAQSFGDRRKWQVDVVDGRELDGYDEMDPIYVLVSDGVGKLIGGQRLLPTTGPHLLADVFAETMGEHPVIRHPLVWECSRFVVDTQAAKERSNDGVNYATRELLLGLVKTAYDAGMVNIVANYDLYMERITRRAGLVAERLGPVVSYHSHDGTTKTVATLIEVSEDVIEGLTDTPVERVGQKELA